MIRLPPPLLTPGASELEVERSVRHQLYGDRVPLKVRPGARRHSEPERLGQLVGGRYRLLERAGVGGMSTVYRAWDERLKRHVAVKVLAEWLARDPASVRQFRREAQLAARLSHPNIVAILDAGGQPRDYIVMELVDGEHAGALVQRRKQLAPREIVHVVVQACDALAYAHGRGVVHHDVSPRNILIRRSDRAVKLADFGIASDGLDTPAAEPASVTGTPGYMAPEVLQGAGPSPLSDLYSLGVVADRLLGGRSATSEAVQRAMAPDPAARQDSVTEFRAELLDGESAPLLLPSAA
jgi:serine/threonine-protein kinase